MDISVKPLMPELLKDYLFLLFLGLKLYFLFIKKTAKFMYQISKYTSYENISISLQGNTSYSNLSYLPQM
jgi:hypothetical protein